MKGGRMKQTKRQRIYIRIIVVFCVLLLLLLAGFQSIWVLAGSASGIMNQTGLQRTRAQVIAKDALILASRPEDEHAQAINELQNILPRFEQAQRGLQNGDAALQLPARVPDDVAPYVQATQSDFFAMDTAARKLLATADGHVDSIQVDIVLAHEHDYSIAMSAVVSAWQTRIDAAFLHIFEWESGIVALLILIIIGKYFLITRHIMKRLLEEAQEKEQKQ
jgi:hypothetical protein